LVNNGTNIHAFKCLVTKSFEEKLRRGTVQARGWFIQDQKRWLHHHLEPHIDTLFLPTRDPTLLHRPNHRISDPLKVQGVYNPLHNENPVTV
jgi:hypothetical protein